jgi:hypothetical protein
MGWAGMVALGMLELVLFPVTRWKDASRNTQQLTP